MRTIGECKAIAQEQKPAWNALKKAMKENDIDVYRMTLQETRAAAIITVGSYPMLEEYGNTEEQKATAKRIVELPEFAAIACNKSINIEQDSYYGGVTNSVRIRLKF